MPIREFRVHKTITLSASVIQLLEDERRRTGQPISHIIEWAVRSIVPRAARPAPENTFTRVTPDPLIHVILPQEPADAPNTQRD